MKIYIILFCIAVSTLACNHDDRCERELSMMFPSFTKKEYLGLYEFIGFSTRGELLETDIWIISGVVLDKNYPICSTSWEDIHNNENLECSTWKNCPISHVDSTKFQHLYIHNVESQSAELSDYLIRLKDPQNFYAFVYDGGVDNYFMLYCPSDDRLYYTRRRGV